MVNEYLNFLENNSSNSHESDQKIILTVNDLTQYFYCPRKFYFLRVLQVPVVAPSKMKLSAQRVHEQEARRNKYRKKSIYGFDPDEIITLQHDVPLFSARLGLKGIADVIIEVRRPLNVQVQNDLFSRQVIPVDIKYTDRCVVRRQWRIQLAALALLIEEDHVMGNIKITQGIIHFSRQRTSVKVPITTVDGKQVLETLKKLRELYHQERMPKAVSSRKCSYCEVHRFCFRDL